MSGLLGTSGGLILQDNHGDNLSITRNGVFTFPTTVPSGAGYNVTILTQPSAPIQTCVVRDGGGTVITGVSNISVDCGHDQWTWMGGSKLFNQSGIYGTMGIAASGNIPGARSSAANWIDGQGNAWLFGGFGTDGEAVPFTGYLNDLWKFSNGQWTWVGGTNRA